MSAEKRLHVRATRFIVNVQLNTANRWHTNALNVKMSKIPAQSTRAGANKWQEQMLERDSS